MVGGLMVGRRLRAGWVSVVISLIFWGGVASGATLSGFSPDRGSPGTEVTLTGSGLQTTAQVYFGSTEAVAQILSVSAGSVRVLVPANALTGRISVFTTGSGWATSTRDFIAAPRVTQFTPETGPVGTVVTIWGENFGTSAAGGAGNITRVAFNGRPAEFRLVAQNQLWAQVPAGASTGPITVSNAAGDATTFVSFHLPAVIGGFAPFKAIPGDAIDIRGQNLAAALRVEIGSVPAAYAVVSPTNLVAFVPTNAVNGRVQVTTPAGLAVTSSNLVVLPRILAVTPATGAVGTNVVLEGGGFHGTTEVLFGAAKAAFTLRSSTRVEAVVPAGATSAPIKITTTNGTFTTTQDFLLPPTLTVFSPTTAQRGDTVTLDGQNLASATRVTFNGAEAEFSVVSGTRLTAVVPAMASSGRIRVQTPAGAAEGAGTFTVRPVIDGFSPTHGVVGSIVNLSGAGLTNLAWVRLGDVEATFTVINPTQLRVVVPLAAYSGPFRVGAASGLSAAGPGNFFVDGAAPELTSMTPASGGPGTSVTLRGRGLLSASRVEFNGAPTTFTVLSSTEVRTVVPAGAATGRVAVTTLDGIAQSAEAFVIPTAPVSLTVERGDGILVLRWPAADPGYRLESSAALGAAASWQPVPGTPVSEGGTFTQAVPLAGSGARFYRLRK